MHTTLHPTLLLAVTLLAGCAASYDGTEKDTSDPTGTSTTPTSAAVCDGVQQDDEVTVDAPFDLDGDGYFDASNPDCVDAWDADHLDCDDGDADVNPGADEVCDGVDNDCDGTADIGAVDRVTWYDDLDGDGFGDPVTGTLTCDGGPGTTEQAGDCDDGDVDVNPDAVEVCDGVDNDCDGLVDDADAGVDLSGVDTLYRDLDGDGFGDPAAPVTLCDPPADAVADDTDCDDADPAAYPGAPETWYDGVDGDCDGWSDYDADRDGADAAAYGGTDCNDNDPTVVKDCSDPTVCLAYNDTESPAASTMGGPNLTLGLQFVAPSAMTVTSIEVWTGDASGTNAIGIWSHDAGANAPDAVIQEGSWTMSSTPSWQGASLAVPVPLAAGTTYWVGWEPINGSAASIATSGTDLTYRGSFDAGASWNGPYAGPWMVRIYCTP